MMGSSRCRMGNEQSLIERPPQSRARDENHEERSYGKRILNRCLPTLV